MQPRGFGAGSKLDGRGHRLTHAVSADGHGPMHNTKPEPAPFPASLPDLLPRFLLLPPPSLPFPSPPFPSARPLPSPPFSTLPSFASPSPLPACPPSLCPTPPVLPPCLPHSLPSFPCTADNYPTSRPATAFVLLRASPDLDSGSGGEVTEFAAARAAAGSAGSHCQVAGAAKTWWLPRGVRRGVCRGAAAVPAAGGRPPELPSR